MRLTSGLLQLLGTAVTRSGRNGRLSILIYHRVLHEPDEMLPDEFDATSFSVHMDALAATFNVLTLEEAFQRLRAGTLPPRAACITFDDGYENNATVALPILQERSLTACFFVSTGFLDGSCMWNDIVIESLRSANKAILDLTEIGLETYALGDLTARRYAVAMILPFLKRLGPSARAEAVDCIVEASGVAKPSGLMMTPQQVKKLADAGMEIGGHTVSHPILSTLSPEQARQEIGIGKEVLDGIANAPVRFFAYPNGRPGRDFDESHSKLVKELGFQAAVTTAPGVAGINTDPMLLPRFTPWDRTPMRFSLRLCRNAAVIADGKY